MVVELFLRELLSHDSHDRLHDGMRLDRAARLGRMNDERGLRIAFRHDGAHTHRRNRVDGLERNERGVRFVVFRERHGRLRGSTLPHEHDRFQTARDQGISEVLNLGKRQRRLTCQRGPAHEITGEKLGIFGEVEKVAVLGVNTTRNLVIDERLRRSTGRSCFKINHRFLPELSMDQPFRLVCLILPK